MSSRGSGPWGPAQVAGAIGFVAHASLVVTVLALGLVAPAWGVVVTFVVWLGLLFVALRLLRTRPWLVLLVPLAMLAFMLALVTAGDLWLGWTG
ncbi:MAG: hypothetical protein M3281_08005 [Chloroflexota bacterium]|nr:hypothetical protein [Chloroflexota bacterium]